MNTTEIADMIRNTPVLSPEFQTAVVALSKYTVEKAATGAPTDRIVATPEDVARHAEEQRVRRIDAWRAKPVRDLRVAAKAAGLKVGTDRVDIACALAAAGVEP